MLLKGLGHVLVAMWDLCAYDFLFPPLWVLVKLDGVNVVVLMERGPWWPGVTCNITITRFLCCDGVTRGWSTWPSFPHNLHHTDAMLGGRESARVRECRKGIQKRGSARFLKAGLSNRT